MTQLIVNADDFGIHSLVNAGIIEGHEKGIITSTSLLATGDAFDEAIALAKTHPSLGIGVHVALVGGLRPACDPNEVSSLLTEEGVFPATYGTFMKWLMNGRIQQEELRKEILQQFSIIMNAGIPITHVDGHQHLHVLPAVLPHVLEGMKQYGLNKIRMPAESSFFFNGVSSMVRIAGKWGLSYVASQAKTIIKKEGFITTDYFWGMINGGGLTEEALLPILKAVAKKQGTHEIMTHPGKNTTVLDDIYHWQYHWDDELQAMMSAKAREYITEENIELINYGGLTCQKW